MQPIVCRRSIVRRVVHHRRPLRTRSSLRPLRPSRSRRTCHARQPLRSLRPLRPSRSRRPGRKQPPLRRTLIRSVPMIARNQRNISRAVIENPIPYSIVRRRRVRALKRHPNRPHWSLRPYRPLQSLCPRRPRQSLRPSLTRNPLQPLSSRLSRRPNRPRRSLRSSQSLRALRSHRPRRSLSRQHTPLPRTIRRRVSMIPCNQRGITSPLPQHHIPQRIIRRRRITPSIHKPRRPRSTRRTCCTTRPLRSCWPRRPGQARRPRRAHRPLRPLNPHCAQRHHAPLPRTGTRRIPMVRRDQRDITRPLIQHNVVQPIVRRRSVRPLVRHADPTL